MTAPRPIELAKAGYEGYREWTGGKTFDGRDMPAWEDLGDIQHAWVAAAGAIERALLTPPAERLTSA